MLKVYGTVGIVAATERVAAQGLENKQLLAGNAVYFRMAKSLSIVPVGDKVVIKPLAAEEKSASGIIIPDTVKKERAERGTVVAVGTGRYEDGDLIPMTVKKGDEVLFEQTYRDPIEIDGEEYYIMSETSVLAIINPKK